jgi:integrase
VTLYAHHLGWWVCFREDDHPVWRRAFATLLQDANVDPLLRQITLGHQPTGAGGALEMTSLYTHSRPTTYAAEIGRVV